MTTLSISRQLFSRLIAAKGQSRSARTIEFFGWLIFAEAIFMFFAPGFSARMLLIPPLNEQAGHYFRLVGLLVGGIGLLYIASGRLNAEGFVLASLLDRPLVPPIMLALWYSGALPGTLALAFSIQDFGGFLWTLAALRDEIQNEQS